MSTTWTDQKTTGPGNKNSRFGKSFKYQTGFETAKLTENYETGKFMISTICRHEELRVLDCKKKMQSAGVFGIWDSVSNFGHRF